MASTEKLGTKRQAKGIETVVGRWLLVVGLNQKPRVLDFILLVQLAFQMLQLQIALACVLIASAPLPLAAACLPKSAHAMVFLMADS
jgi:hypothetical protein